jgi:hypothetical protein
MKRQRKLYHIDFEVRRSMPFDYRHRSIIRSIIHVIRARLDCCRKGVAIELAEFDPLY